MDMRETWEFLSYVVTVIGLPFALLVFIYEQHVAFRTEEFKSPGARNRYCSSVY